MKCLIIISFLIVQSSGSFFDLFAPVESSFGKLVTDVVSDIKDTIDCTILAVEHVFSLEGIFGDSSNYEERCRGQKPERTVITSSSPEIETYSYKTQEPSNDEDQERSVKEEISRKINDSVSAASQHIKNIIEKSKAQQKMESVKNTLKSESDRLAEINAILSQELRKIPENFRKKFKFGKDRSTIDNLLDEIKLLYKFEQKDKSSAQANEVRRVFDEVLKALRVNDTGGTYSDEDEVKEIIRDLGQTTNDSFVDVEKQVSQWTKEQNKELTDIKDVVINTANTQLVAPDVKTGDKNTPEINIVNKVINKNLDEIEEEQVKIVEFSNSLNDLAKSILDKVSVTSTPLPLQKITVKANMTQSPTGNSTIIKESLLSQIQETSNSSTTLSESTNPTTTHAPTTEVVKSSSTESSSLQTNGTNAQNVLHSNKANATLSSNQPKNLTNSSVNLKKDTIVTTTLAPQTKVKVLIYTERLPSTQSTPTTRTPPIIEEQRTTLKNAPSIQSTTEATQKYKPKSITTTVAPAVQSSTPTIGLRTTLSSIVRGKTVLVQTPPIITTTKAPVVPSMQKSVTLNNQGQGNLPSVQPSQRPTSTQASPTKVQTPTSATQPPPLPSTSKLVALPFVPPKLSPPIPKSFKDVATKIFNEAKPLVTTTDQPPANVFLDPFSTLQSDDAAYDDFAYADSETLNLALINQFFGNQDANSQKEAAQSAKNLIENSKLTNSLMNDAFSNANRANAPNIFDDPSLLGFGGDEEASY